MPLWSRLKSPKNNTSGNPRAVTDLQALRSDAVYQDLKRSHQELKLRDRIADVTWKEWYYKLRVIWATLTIVLLGITLWFTYWLVKGVGEGRLQFENNNAFLNIIAGDIIINVLGLVAIVMHFLFPKNGK